MDEMVEISGFTIQFRQEALRAALHDYLERPPRPAEVERVERTLHRYGYGLEDVPLLDDVEWEMIVEEALS